MKEFESYVNDCLARIKGGDVDCFDEFYRATKERIKNYARSRLNDKLDADDVVTETYFKILKGISLFDVTKNGYSWMRKIAANVAYDYNMRSGGGKAVSLDDDSAQALSYDADDTGELKYDLWIAQNALSEKEFEVFKRCVIDDMTINEASDAMHEPHSTVHYRLKTAKNKLKKYLSDNSET